MFDIDRANRNLYTLCDAIAEYQSLESQWHGYITDPSDIDIEGCFV